MFDAVFAYVVVFGGLFALLLGAGRLLAGEKEPGDYYLAALFFCLGVMLLCFVADMRGVFMVFPHAAVFTLLTLPLLGPLMYVYFSRALNMETRSKPYRLIHAWPAPVMLLLMAPIVFRPAEFKFALYTNNLYSPELKFLRGYQDVVLIFIMLVMLVYLGALLRRMSFMWEAGALKRERSNRIGTAIIVGAMVNILLYMLGQVANDGGLLFRLAAMMTSVLLAAIYLLGQRSPSFLPSLRTQAARARYEKSRIKGLDVRAISRRMHELMETDKLYSDEDLTLADLARELSVSSHQLSEILNEHIQKSFKNFVNEFRVGAAREMLEREPERTILSISAAAGFNSKSSFNAVFRSMTGKTPTEYKKEKAGLSS